MIYGKLASTRLAGEVAKAREDKQRVRHLTIERALEWAYGDQRVLASDNLRMDEESFVTGYDNGMFKLMLNGLMGCSIDGGGQSSFEAHPDAVTIHRVVCDWGSINEYCSLSSALLISHALAGTRPEKPVGREYYEPVKNREGRIVVSYWVDGSMPGERAVEESSNGRPASIRCNSDRVNYPIGQACDIRLKGQREELSEYMDDLYVKWRDGITAIHSELPRLQTIKIVNNQEFNHDDEMGALAELLECA